jgi:aspartyl aminopeptidase
VVKGGRYFYNRNGSTLVAFTVGGRYQPGNGFKVFFYHMPPLH